MVIFTYVLTQNDQTFGMLVPTRHGSSDSYRYGFQGQEKDDEIKGEGNSLNYTFRMHDPRVGRFFAIDPLENKYPWYTPYQFSGNRLIDMVELEGLEPAEPDQKEYKGKTGAIDLPFTLTGGDNKYNTNKCLFGSSTGSVDKSKFFGNNDGDVQMRYVNEDSQYSVSKATENKFNSDRDLVNTLLGNFAWGEGPENLVFPENGKFSTSLKSSIAVGETLAKWAKNDYKYDTYSWGMDARGELNVDVNSGFTSLEHFLGSVAIRIGKVNDKDIRVEIFNVTSFTSGNLSKDIPIMNWFTGNPASTIRASYQVYPYLTNQRTYSNISQYFSFTMSKIEADKIIKQFGGK